MAKNDTTSTTERTTERTTETRPAERPAEKRPAENVLVNPDSTAARGTTPKVTTIIREG